MERDILRSCVQEARCYPNVVGAGLGYKRTGRRDTGIECVVVLVQKKLPPGQLERSALLPPEIHGVPTDVIETGRFRALADPAGLPDRTGRWRPAPGGVSIGHPDISAGTLGALVWDTLTGQPLILSNNHVMANSSTSASGTPERPIPILQPGPYDGGREETDTIGYLLRFSPLQPNGINRFDAALATVAEPDRVTRRILRIGYLKGIHQTELGMRVRKSGRTTGLTTGRVTVIDTTLDVDFEDWVLEFENQVLCSLRSRGGDSGSVIVDEGKNAVGLLFAGSPFFTAYTPIIPLAETLGFRVTP